LALVGITCFAPLALAEIFVQPGADLAALLASAPDGEVLTFQGDAVFVGSFFWQNKSLTLRSSPGTTTVLRGLPGLPTLSLSASTFVSTGARIEGLRIEAGLTAPGQQSQAISVGGTGSGNPTIDLALDQCTWVGALTISGTGTLGINASCQSCQGDTLNLLGTGASRSDVRAKGLKVEDISVAGTGQKRIELVLEDSSFTTLGIGGTGDSQQRVELRRVTGELLQCFGVGDGRAVVTGEEVTLGELRQISSGNASAEVRFRGGALRGDLELAPNLNAVDRCELGRMELFGSVRVVGTSSQPAELWLESCILSGPGAGGQSTAIYARSPDRVRGVNLTIVKHALALDTAAPSQFSNCLLQANRQAGGALLVAGDVDHCLSDQALFAGQNGNLFGQALWDERYAPLPGSLALDAGNPLVALRFDADFDGALRLLDGNGDGQARIDIGAIEHFGNCPPAAAFAVALPVALPPLMQLLSLPRLGSNLEATIATTPETAGTVLAVDLPLTVPLTLPGITGPLLLADTQNLVLSGGQGFHSLSVPNKPGLCGAELRAQGFRLRRTPISYEIEALNAFDLVLGY
jgi:hypothetical protein